MASALDMVAGVGQFGFDPLADIYEGRKTRFATNEMNRADQARPLMGQALQGDSNALNSLAGVDPAGFMEVSGFQDKRQKAEDERANALSERVAAMLNWADTPEKWQVATQRIQANGIELEPQELDFNNRGAMLAEYQTIKEQRDQSNKDREFSLEQWKASQSGGARPPSGYRNTQEGDLEPIPGGPADPTVKNAKNSRLSPMPAELASRIGLAKDFMAQYPGLRAKIEGGSFGEPELGVDNFSKRRDLVLRRGEQGEIVREIKGGSEALTRMLTGAGMNMAEATNEVQQYLPEATDTSATILSKLDMLHRRLDGMVKEASAGRVSADTSPAVAQETGAADGEIPTQAVEELLADPGGAAEFDEIFGPGAAARVLGQQ